MRPRNPEELELSVILPCLNEEETIEKCVLDAQSYFERNNINGEVIVVDNGSSDASESIARKAGANVIMEPKSGYGNALIRGLSESRGKVLILADSDTTYDVSDLTDIYTPLINNEADVVIGDRFLGGIKEGAMSFSHKIGVPILSFLGRMRYNVEVNDFHCGLRGLTREALIKMELRTPGMEFATEFIAEAARNNLAIKQTPVVLYAPPSGRSSKLHTVRDGFRHLFYIIFHK